MAGLFNTLNTANKGLFAQQTALHVTGHNLSNAETPGYTRQRVELKADLPYRLPGIGYLGTGVKVESIIRYSNQYVAKQIRQESHDYGKFIAKSEAIDELEMIFNEPTSSGLNFYMGEMFDSWKELSVNPELSTSKTLVVEKSQAFADIANHMLKQMDNLNGETHAQIDKEVLDFNSAIDKLQVLNQNIHNAAIRGGAPNDLLDERDLLLKNMSESMDFKAGFDEFGRASISVTDEAGNSVDMLKFNGEKEVLTYERNPDSNEAGTFKLGDKEIKVSSGAMAGYKDSIKDVEGAREDLINNLKVVTEAINKTHSFGETKDDIFKLDEGSDPVLTISDVYTKDHSKINAGKVGGAAGDGSVALNLSKIRDIKFNTKEDGSIENTVDPETETYEQSTNGKTVEGMYRDTVATIGISKQHSDNMIKNQESLLNQLFLRRESESGVNIDEEVTNVIKFQRSYEANARVISVVSEMLDTLINRTGV